MRHVRLSSGCADLADIRLANTLSLFDAFKNETVVGPAGDDLKGLDARFSEQLRISASYWSQLKSRNRQIGETLARQFEVQCVGSRSAGSMQNITTHRSGRNLWLLRLTNGFSCRCC